MAPFLLRYYNGMLSESDKPSDIWIEMKKLDYITHLALLGKYSANSEPSQRCKNIVFLY